MTTPAAQQQTENVMTLAESATSKYDEIVDRVEVAKKNYFYDPTKVRTVADIPIEIREQAYSRVWGSNPQSRASVIVSFNLALGACMNPMLHALGGPMGACVFGALLATLHFRRTDDGTYTMRVYDRKADQQ